MPELPEVEVICRGLRPHLIGRKIESVSWYGKPLRLPVPIDRLQREMVGQTIVTVERRAKYLQIYLNTKSVLIVHLGMTGNMGIFESSSQKSKHDHVEWVLSDGISLRFNDIRRFGSIQLLSGDEAINKEQTVFATTGPEPFSKTFSASYVHTLAKQRDIPVKTFLMTNKVVAGIGNIYANESLFTAGIRPTKKAKRITRREWNNLITEIREVLTNAIKCGGSTISDFVGASQEKGYFQMNFTVYGKEGQPCTKCSTTIKKITIGGRASFYCPQCQK